MNKIFKSLLIIITVVIVVGTAACFMGNKIGVTFSVAELVLKIRDQDEWYKEGGVVGTWTAENMLPGDGWTFDAPFVGLLNTGGILGDHLEITCDYAVIEEEPRVESDTDPNTNLHPDGMAKEMIIMKSIYRGFEKDENGDFVFFCIDALKGKKYPFFNTTKRECSGLFPTEDSDWKIEDYDGDGKITFFDLKNDMLDNLPPPNEEVSYIMDVMFAADAGNNFQGDAFDLEMSFTSKY